MNTPKTNAPKRIASFLVDHDYITPGVYISRIDGDIYTYDLRTRRPNAGDYMDNVTMHTVEHLFATYVRSSEIGDEVIYFGPMGCRTGFYLLVRDVQPSEVYSVIRETLSKIAMHEGEVFDVYQGCLYCYKIVKTPNAVPRRRLAAISKG